jgi:hypothetical protein
VSDEEAHLRAEIDRLQRELIICRDKLAEMTVLKERGWALVYAVRSALDD